MSIVNRPSSRLNGFWGLFWRMVVFGPFIAILGILTLLAVVGLTVAPPVLAVVFVIDADYFWAVALLFVWIVWLKFGGPVRRFISEGTDYAGL